MAPRFPSPSLRPSNPSAADDGARVANGRSHGGGGGGGDDDDDGRRRTRFMSTCRNNRSLFPSHPIKVWRAGGL